MSDKPQTTIILAHIRRPVKVVGSLRNTLAEILATDGLIGLVSAENGRTVVINPAHIIMVFESTTK